MRIFLTNSGAMTSGTNFLGGDEEDERYDGGDDNEDDADDEETEQQQGRVELPPSRSGRTRWANPRYQWWKTAAQDI